MNRNTRPAPSSDAWMPSRIESAPSDGPIERSSSSTSGIGSAPERSWIAVLFASSRVKSPVISPRRPILLWITGAVITLPSMIAASRWPMFAPVKSRKTFAPSAFHWNVMSGRLRRSNSMRASSSMSPFRTAFLGTSSASPSSPFAVGVEHDLLVLGHALAELRLEQLLAGRGVDHRLELEERGLLDQRRAPRRGPARRASARGCGRGPAARSRARARPSRRRACAAPRARSRRRGRPRRFIQRSCSFSTSAPSLSSTFAICTLSSTILRSAPRSPPFTIRVSPLISNARRAGSWPPSRRR